ncbi:MAG: tetratricopeptide (TPR) repeat protein [Cryomorphaceae bacterium]|jgi:tetratricopeptide (TPR) repeat protein
MAYFLPHINDSTYYHTQIMIEPILEFKEGRLPQNLRVLWLKSLSAVELQNFSYAVSLCQAILKDAPGFVEARKLARRCAVRTSSGNKKKGNAVTQIFSSGVSIARLQSQIKKDVRAGLMALEKELEKDPNSGPLNDLLFDTAVQQNLYETAIFALETVRKGAPENTKLLHKLANYYLVRDIPQEAAGVYKDIIKQDSTDIHAVKGEKDATARASMKKGGWENGGIEDSRKDSSGDKEQEESDRAGMTRDQKKAKLTKLMEQYHADQNNLGVVKEIAVIYEDFGYWPDAHVFYSWAYQLSHKDTTLKNKAEKMKSRDAEEQIEKLEEKLVANPENEELKAEILAYKQERSKESVSEAQARVDQNPTDPQLRFDLGLALYNSGDFNGAIPHLQQAKRNPHIRTRVLLTLGRSFDAKGMFDIANHQLEEALEDLHAMDGTKKEVLYEMGLIYSKMDNKEKALQSFKEIYEVDYGYRDVAKRVEDAYSA